MADDAHVRMREILARAEKRTLAWVAHKRPELADKSLSEVIITLRQEEREARPVRNTDSSLDSQPLIPRDRG